MRPPNDVNDVCIHLNRAEKLSKRAPHNRRGDLNGPLSWSLFVQDARWADFAHICGRGGLCVKCLLKVPGTALRALCKRKIKIELKKVNLGIFRSN